MDIEFELMSRELAQLMLQFLKIAEPDIGRKIDRTAIDMLKEIRTAVCDESLSDFDVVEKIVRIFEENNIDCKGRHDF